jgi:apolipoprotein D and lipocalin family protein
MPRTLVRNATWAVLLLATCRIASAQTVTAVPKLDVDRFTGSWYEIARLPVKREKSCVSDVVQLFAQGDKNSQLQSVGSCKTSKGYTNVWNATETAQDKIGDGKYKVTFVWPFSAMDWVLATGPDYDWALVGNPNHKELWIFSRTPAMSPDVLAAIKSQAVAQGFSAAKLISTPQTATVMVAR